MKKVAFLLVSFFLISNINHGQLPDGSMAPDFTLTDIDGNAHTLSDYLADGKTVFIDFFATWCPPCWNYHQTHALQDLYTTYGSEIMVLGIEADGNTPLGDIYGGGSSLGDWTVGISYPIFSPSGAALSVVSDYAVDFYPTVYGICSDGTIYEVGQQSTNGQYNFHQNTCSSFSVTVDVVVHEDCFESMDGSIMISTSDPNQTYTYEWSNGSDSEDLLNIGAGLYWCTVTSDNSGYEVFVPAITITGPDSPLEMISEFVTDATCFEEANGEITVSAVGGTTPYTFFWSNGDVGETISYLEAGIYTVNVLDANNCSIEVEYTIDEPEDLDNMVLFAPATCGDDNGEIDVISSGGVEPYTYDIGEGESNNSNFSSLPPGSYSLLIIDANGCEDMIDVSIEAIPSPVFQFGMPDELTCDMPSVSLSTNHIDSTENLMFSWSTVNGNIIGPSEGLEIEVGAPGLYILSLTDTDFGCVTTDTLEVFGDSEIPQVEILGNFQIDCLNSQAILNAEVEGDNPNNTISWTDSDGNQITDQTQVSINIPGIYILTITNEQTGCQVQEEVEVVQNTEPPTFEIQTSGFIDCENELSTLFINTNLEDIESSIVDVTGAHISDFIDEVSIGEGGLYYITVTNLLNGCASTQSIAIEDNSEIPSSGFSYEIERGNLYLNVIDVLDQADVVYKWIGCGGLSLFGEQQVVDIDLSRLPCVVCLTASNSCGDNFECQLIELPTTKEGERNGELSLGNNGEELEIVSIFPNPANHYINVRTPYSLEPVELKIYSSFGQIMLTRSFPSGTTEMINIDFLNDGLYFIKVRQGPVNKIVRQVVQGNNFGQGINLR